MSSSEQGDKLDIYKDKIQKIIKGLWTIQTDQFSIEITIKSKSNRTKPFSRIMNQNELRALKTQIKLGLTNSCFNSIKKIIFKSSSEKSFMNSIRKKIKNGSIKILFDHDFFNLQLGFLYRYYKMKEFKNIIQYFNQQGITELEEIHSKTFEIIEDRLKIIDEDLYLNQRSLSFSLQKLQSNTFRIIGNNIQRMNSENRDEIFKNICPFINAISGQILNGDTFYQRTSEFLNDLSPEILFDSTKLGYCFCNHILIPPNVAFQQSSNDKNPIFDTIPYLKQSIQTTFYSKNLMFFKVVRPAHCYHCIKSLSKLLTVNNRRCQIYLNEKTLIFCKNGGNFAEQIQQIPKSSAKDSEGSNLSTVYFIVHPETLNDEDYSLLEEFISTRICYVNDIDLPKVIIISTSNFEKSFSFFSNEFREIKFEINDEEEIEAFYNLSLNGDSYPFNYYLYKSEHPGYGKTYQIHERMNQIQKEERTKTNPQTLFIDSNMKYLPPFEDSSIVHFDLSPELFDEKFGFFDDLWIFCNLHYHILPNGENIKNPKYIFFEAPTLTSNQHIEGGSIRAVDFPIAIPPKNIVEVKSSDTKILLSPEIQSICKKVFQLPEGKDLLYTSDLLNIALNMFYPSIFDGNNELFFDLRIINETNLFLNRFCKDLKFDKDNLELSQTLFLLLLRTNFHIWTMESVFKDKKQPKSFIILANQNLFNEEPSKKWNLLCFCSNDEKECNKWETKHLIKEIKDKIEGVSDSTLFEYDFFKKLNQHKDLIDVYSNLLGFNDNQIVYFKIISSFFLIDNKDKSFYTDMIDSYIVTMFSDSFDENDNIYSIITDSLTIGDISDENYFNDHHELRQPFKVILEILTRRRNEASYVYENIENLRNKRKILEEQKGKKYQIDSMIFTITLVKRFIIMILRIILNQPLILEGFTGVGKTAAVHLLNTLIDIAHDSIKWRFHQIDCHGDLLFDNIKEDVINRHLNYYAKSESQSHIFFFDELNTSPGSCCVINYMNNYNMIQKLNKEVYERNITFIAAINPYIEVDKTTRDLSRVGIKQIIPTKICKLKLCKVAPEDRNDYYETPDLNKLAYNVRELSESTKMIILKSDPELFLLTEKDIDINNNENNRFLPPDEIEVIKNMIFQYYKLLPQIIPDEDFSDFVKEAIDEYSEVTIKIISDLICESFICIRGLMLLRSILSYRDVKRFMMHFLNFFRKHIKKEKNNLDNQEKASEYIRKTAIPKSLIYSLMLSIVFRFSSHTRIDNKEEEELKNRCENLNFDLIIKKEGEFLILDIFTSLINKLNQINWEVIEKPINQKWIDIIINDFSDKIFTKYANISGIFKLKSLVIHLFAISSCYSVSKHFPNESIMPCLIIGMPGTSKTLAIQLFTNHKNQKNNFFSTTYLSTRASEADGLNAHYRDCAMFMIENDDDDKSLAICVIDELGLANLNETRPLKLLHYYFDKGISMKFNEVRNEQNESKLIRVMSIAASNYALDFANMNRGILICTDLPSDEDISNSFQSDSEQVKKFLQALWKLTDNTQRPEMLALRPLYLLYNVLFINASRYFYDICTYLTSVISCHPSKAPEKARELIRELEIDEVQYDTNEQNTNSTDIMCRAIDNMCSAEALTRALCVRTKNYDCLDYIEEMIEKIASLRSLECSFYHIYPTDFKMPSHVCADSALRQIFNLITEDEIDSKEKNFFLIIGNASFSDALLDLLNVPTENKGEFNIETSSLISQNGFSIKLDSIPNSFNIIFILNDEDFEKKNSVDSFPLPLLDRFDQVYFDYESNDQYKIVENHRDFRINNEKYLISDSSKIHDYFLHFIDKLNDVPRPERNQKNPLIIVEESETEEISNKFLGENYRKSENFDVHLSRYGEDLNFPPTQRVIARFLRKNSSKKQKIIKETKLNIKKIKPTFDNVYIANHSRNDFYELDDEEPDQFIKKTFFNFQIESFNGSIIGLKDYINKKNSNNDSIRAIIFTISPMMETLKDVNDKNSIILFDQYIGSSKLFEEKVYDELNDETQYLIIQSNQFSNGSKSQSKALVHDRHIRYLLSEISIENPNLNLIIIYHLKDSVKPIGINTSKEWPVFWMESVSDSPLDANDSNQITKCILFREEYRNNYAELVSNIFEQLYLDLWTNFNILLPASSLTTVPSESKKPNKSSKKKKNVQKKSYSSYPKLTNEIKSNIFDLIIKQEKIIANENGKNDFDDFIFRSLFYTLRSDSYLSIDLKRLFYEKLKNYLPSYLSFFVKLLISNTNKFNKNLQNDLKFIHNLYNNGFIQSYFRNYVTNQFQPFAVSEKAPYFPELILEQVLILYDQKYTGSIKEVLNYIDQYKNIQVSREDIVINYLKEYFLPILKVIKPNEKEKEKMIKIEDDFYTAFETLLLLRGGYASETTYSSLHDHLQEFNYNISTNLTYQNFITYKSMNDKLDFSRVEKLMKTNVKIIDLFYKYQLLTNVCDNSRNLTSINKDDLNSSNLFELTQMCVLGRPFMDNDSIFIDFIKKTNESMGQNGAENYILSRRAFINMIYFEKLVNYCKGERKVKFEIKHDDNFFNYHYVYPENAFNEIEVFVEDMSNEDINIISRVNCPNLSSQLFENEIFQKTFNLIKSFEFPKFKTSSKSYIKDVSDFIYPHEMIRKNILHKCDYSSESFSEWLFDTDAPLFVRQLYATFNSIKEKNKKEIIRELTVFSLLLNPWSKDPTVLILFWNYINENIANFIPKETDSDEKYIRISKNIQKAFERTKWNYPLQQGKIYYIFENKCVKPQLSYEINYRLDNLIFSIAISNDICVKDSKYSKYLNIFKALPYAHLIQEIPYILAFSEFLQKKFIIELDTLFVILSTINCEELTRIGDGMKGISLYEEIQNCIETNEGLLENNIEILQPNQIKNILIKINQIYPGKSSYEQINLYTRKIVDLYNSAFSDFCSGESIKFNQVQLSNLMFNFNIRDLIVPSSFMISIENGSENGCTIDVENFLKTAFSSKTKFSKRERLEVKNIFPKNIRTINYPSDFDFLGFKIGQFSKSLFNSFDLKEVVLNTECFIKLQSHDELYKEKTLAMSLKCRPYPKFDPGDDFDALAYLLVIFSRSKEKVPDKENLYKFLFYDITNNSKTRINQVFENLRSLESNVDFQKSRVHIKSQHIIKKVIKKLIPNEIQGKYQVLFS